MAAFLQALAGWPGAVLLQKSWTAYLFINAAHILGIALLLGAILPLDLRLLHLLGKRHDSALPVLAPFLVRTAATGAVLAVITGLWLLSVKPLDYLHNPSLLTTATSLILAFCNVVLRHHGPHLDSAVRSGQITARIRLLAASSALLWLSILVAGRWIGFI